MHGSVEADDYNECKSAEASDLWVEDEVAEAHHQVQDLQCYHLIEYLHVI